MFNTVGLYLFIPVFLQSLIPSVGSGVSTGSVPSDGKEVVRSEKGSIVKSG